MLSILLENTNIKTKTKIGIKTIIATIFIALAVILPQLVHLIAQANGGMMWLPMYYPVISRRITRNKMGIRNWHSITID